MKIKIIILAILTLIVLVGCTGGSNEGEYPNWKTGNQGIVLELSQNRPPNEIYAGETYPIVLELRNRGGFPEEEDDSLDVDLYFSGFDRNLIDLPYDDSIDIEGRKSQTNPEGGLAFYEEEFDVRLYEDADSLPQDIRVTACYDYETLAPIDVCVDPNPTRNDEDTCNPGISSGLGGQAAPIGVPSIQQESLKEKVRFTIKISNVGGGSVFRETDCLNPERSDKDVVELLAVYLGDEELDCTPSEWIRIINGVGTITCTGEDLDEDEPAYRTSLGVQLGYSYKDSITKRVLIKRIEWGNIKWKK